MVPNLFRTYGNDKILLSMSNAEAAYKEIKDYTRHYERSMDGTREIHGVQRSHYMAGSKRNRGVNREN